MSLAVGAVHSVAPTPLGLFSVLTFRFPGDSPSLGFPQVFINDTPTSAIEVIHMYDACVGSGRGRCTPTCGHLVQGKDPERAAKRPHSSLLRVVVPLTLVQVRRCSAGSRSSISTRRRPDQWVHGVPGAPGSGSVRRIVPGGNCPAGGVRLYSATGVTYACNGAAGAPGTPGQPGVPAGGILLLAPGSPRPAGFSLIGTLFGFALMKKDEHMCAAAPPTPRPTAASASSPRG